STSELPPPPTPTLFPYTTLFRSYTDLVQRRAQLTTLQALQTAGSAVVRNAVPGVKVAPRPLRNVVLALAIGLILGIGLGFLYDADRKSTRLNSSHVAISYAVFCL